MLLPETILPGARDAAERLRHCIANQPVEMGQGLLNVTISVGLAVLKDESMTAEELLKHADEALYQAKETGRNRVCVYDE